MTVAGTITAIRVKEITTITIITVAVVDALVALDVLVKVVVVVVADVLVIGQCPPVLVVKQYRPGDRSNILSFFAVEVHHAPQSVCAKDLAK